MRSEQDVATAHEDLNVHDVPVNQLFRKLTERYFLETISEGARVLDCGCGDGAIALPLAARGVEVDAFDMAEDRIAMLNRLKGELPIAARVCDFWGADFPKESYDFVISRQFMVNFPNWKKALDHKLSFVKAGGCVAFTQNSVENRRAAARWSLTRGKARRILKWRGAGWGSQPTVKAIDRYCKKRGLTLDRCTPMAFFLPVAPTFRATMTKDQREAYGRALAEHLAHPDVYEFAMWFDREVASLLAPELTCQLFVVIRKARP